MSDENDRLLEAQVIRPCVEYAQIRGWFVERIREARRRGFPDHYFLRAGVTRLCEFKRPGEEPKEHQVLRHEQIREHGGIVDVMDNLADFKKVYR